MATVTARRETGTASLRTGVLDLGSRLGWDRVRTEAFAEAVTGQPWKRCGRAQLHQTLVAYAALAARVRAAAEIAVLPPEEG